MTAPRPPAPRADGSFVSADAELGDGVSLAPGAVVHAGAVIGAGCTIGAGAVVHSGSRLGERVLVEAGAVLGKRPRLRPESSAVGSFGDLEVADDATICCGAVVYAGAAIGRRAIVGDQSQVRERGVLGEGSVLGRGSTIDFDTRVGARVSIQTLAYVTAGTIVEDDVFIGPGVIMTNDDSMGRHGAGTPLRGATLKRACRIGGGVVLTPGVEIGEEAFVAAGAVVVRDVPERAVVMGVPGRVVRQVGEDDLLEGRS
ncbi:MAG TPA: DapH/DapD/GlmU-related protein [Solirubrobacteraceae bacterium]|jgi:acetyltransferase-like isoleucine patch superfamily enzyme|nr:DapH/DapD/GlmU-related protein [Solirubrobacteraceae bacterium]